MVAGARCVPQAVSIRARAAARRVLGVVCISPPIVARGLVSPGDTFRAMREATSQVGARRAPRAGAGRPTSHTGPGPSGPPDAPAGPGARRDARRGAPGRRALE